MNKTPHGTKPNSVPNINVPATNKKKGKGKEMERAQVLTGDVSLRSTFTREMALRAIEDGISPLEFLWAIVANPKLEFTDWLPCAGELIQVERTATLAERIDCARTILPYVKEKKISVEHNGQVQILHALAESPLDSIILDEEGRVIDADDAEFEELE